MKSIPFGAGPHICAGASASRALVAKVALPRLFARFPDLELDERTAVQMAAGPFAGRSICRCSGT